MSIDKKALIQDRLQKAFQPSQLSVTDDSDAHIGHAGYQGGNRHFSVTIRADAFDKLPSVTAHRKIYALFDDLIPDEIHALKIKILK